MNEHSNIVPLRQPDEIDDPLTNILRSGARQLLAQAVEMEAEAFLAGIAMAGATVPALRSRTPLRRRWQDFVLGPEQPPVHGAASESTTGPTPTGVRVRKKT